MRPVLGLSSFSRLYSTLIAGAETPTVRVGSPRIHDFSKTVGLDSFCNTAIEDYWSSLGGAPVQRDSQVIMLQEAPWQLSVLDPSEFQAGQRQPSFVSVTLPHTPMVEARKPFVVQREERNRDVRIEDFLIATRDLRFATIMRELLTVARQHGHAFISGRTFRYKQTVPFRERVTLAQIEHALDREHVPGSTYTLEAQYHRYDFYDLANCEVGHPRVS